MDSTNLGLAVQAMFNLDDKHAQTVIDILQALNNQRPEQADVISGQFEMILRHVGKAWEGQVDIVSNNLQQDKVADWAQLTRVTTVLVPAANRLFVANKRFVVDTSDDAVVKVASLGDEEGGEASEEGFFSMTELPFLGSVISVKKLWGDSTVESVLQEIGGKEKAVTTLTEIWALLKKQGRGQKEGVLLTDGEPNSFFVYDRDRRLWLLRSYYRDEGWEFGANIVRCGGGIEAGQVLSRDYLFLPR
jgi:hypothetical protein